MPAEICYYWSEDPHSGIGNDQIWAGLNTDIFHGGWQQVQAGLNATWQECQQNWNKAQAAWGRGDYGRAVSYATGFTSDMQRATQWVNDNNRDWDILRDPGCSETVREAAGKRIFGRGFELAGWLVVGGIGAKNAFNKVFLAEGVLSEAEIEEYALVADQRAQTLQDLLGPVTKDRVTMGAGVVQDARGSRFVIIGTSEQPTYLRPAVKAAVWQAGERVAPSVTNHAEQNIVRWATANGNKVIAVGAGRPVCPECARAIWDAGGSSRVRCGGSEKIC